MRVGMTVRLALAALVAVTVVSGCSSGTTTGGRPSALSVKSVSVPPDVPKDSIRDLNSTKDMTGVVTDIPSSQSPYYRHMPEMCPFFPKEARDKAKAMGADNFGRGFASNIIQSCGISPFDTPNSFFAVSAFMSTEPLSQMLKSSGSSYTGVRIALPRGQVGHEGFPAGLDIRKKCTVTWGTFFGSAQIEFSSGPFDPVPAPASP